MSNKRKRHKKKQSNARRQGLIAAGLITITVVAGIVAAVILYNQQKEENTGERINASEEKEGLTFPHLLEEGKISVDSIFQFTGFNPDSDNMEGENIAALTVINQSEQHLASAEIKVKTGNGKELVFEITDVPAGQKAMVFEKANETLELDDVCEEITDTAEFEDRTDLMEDSISIDVQETEVILTNNSEEVLTNLLLHCHCLIDDSYFGGLTYTYPVDSIPAGQSISVEAEDCYLGEAAVVRVSQDNGGE